MTIYDKDKGVLYLPENENPVDFDEKEVYRQAFALGYEDGRRKAEEECYENL